MQYTCKHHQIELRFLSDEELKSAAYAQFLRHEECRKFWHIAKDEVLSKSFRTRKIGRYSSYYGIKILVSIVDGVIVGQSCAFKSYAIVKGTKAELWWGIDNYVLSNYRGLGLGKNMQALLHKELPNFSSAWYTPINGIIKAKCGAKGIFDITFNYYPISSAITVFGDLCFRKLFHRGLPVRVSLPYFYYRLNALCNNARLKGYTVSEIPYAELGERESEFMEQALSVTDFHIERSVKFLRWKYGNLRVGYHMLSIDKDGETECIVAFSEVYNSGFDVAPIKGVTVYDLVIAPTSKLTTKQVVLHIAYRLKERGESFDGIQMLSDCCYLGKLRYPFHKCAVMSTVADKIQRGYLTFADHDMDQI